MSIVGVEVLPYRLPLRRPWRTATGMTMERAGFLVRLTDGSGRCGFGEAGPVYWAGGESLASVAAALGVAAEWLRAGDPADRLHEALCGEVRTGTAAALPTALRQSPAALCAIDTALLDLLARAAGQSVATFLSAAARPAVACNGIVSDAAPDAVEVAVAELVAADFRTIKLKVAAQPADVDCARVAAVRRAATTGVRIRLDANRGWDPATAAHVLAAVAGADIDYVEEPLATPDPTALRALRERTGVPIALDESVTGAADLTRYTSERAADVVVVKLARVGGLCRAVRLAQTAQAGGLCVVCTDAVETTVGRRATVHAAAALPGPALPVGLGGALLAADVIADAPQPAPVVAVDGPGLGPIILTTPSVA